MSTNLLKEGLVESKNLEISRSVVMRVGNFNKSSAFEVEDVTLNASAEDEVSSLS